MIHFTPNYVLITIVWYSVCLGQFIDHGQHQQPIQNYYKDSSQKTPPPQIISYKQAQNHDGSFKYLFTAENGLAQGESIAPDGTRNGRYEYVDPTGKKIAIRYTAGKEGFNIIEDDHIPKVPIQPAAAVYPEQGLQQHQEFNNYQPQIGNHLYGTENNNKLAGPSNPTYKLSEAQSTSVGSQTEDDDSYKDKLYNDEPGKPHSFGAGYAFQISG